MLHTLWLTALFCLTPAGVIWLCRRYPMLDKIGPIMMLYAIGMVVGNLPIMPAEIHPLQEMLPNVVIPLAIPMMLFGCTFSRREAGLQLKLVVSGFASIVLAVVLGYLLFGHRISHGTEVGGIISGMYTGGTLNAAALQTIFHIPSETFVLINSYDILISFLYFVFLFGVGIKLFRRLYGQKRTTLMADEQAEIERQIALQKENPYRQFFTRKGLGQLARTLLATVAIVTLSGGVAMCCPEGWFMVAFILMLTSMGVASSFLKPIRSLTVSYDAGMYLIYIFSMAIASMADFSNLDLASGTNQIAFMSMAVFCSLFLHAIFCRLMRIDADSMVISSVAFINSPPFVPMVSAAMQNKSALVTGLGAGIVGYALGNHLGVLMEQLLALL